MLNNLDSHKVKVIQAVCHFEGITEAALELKVTPSAVSQCIRSVEKDLKKQLFIRVGKKLKPTPITMKLTELAMIFFSSMNELMHDDKDPNLSGHLRIGAPPTLGSNWITPKVTQFLMENPLVKVTLSLGDTPQMVEMLNQNKYDLIFVDGDIHLSGFKNITSVQLHAEELVMCCSKKFYKEVRGKEDYKELIKFNHIPFHDGKEGTHKWYQYHYGKSPNFAFRFSVDSTAGIVMAVREDFGLGVVPLSVVEAEIKSGSLVVIEGKKKTFQNKIYYTQLSEKIPTRLEKSFLKFMNG